MTIFPRISPKSVH